MKITKNTIVYHIENENGELYWSINPPDYVRTRLIQKMTLGALIRLVIDQDGAMSQWFRLLREIITQTDETK